MPTNLILSVVSTQFLLMALLSLFTVAQAKPPNKSNHLKVLNCAADQIAKFDGEEWVRAADDISDSKELVDANGQVIGSVLDVANLGELLVQLN